MTLADQYDALRWKHKLSHEEARDAILEGNDRVRPTQFDPRLLKIFESEATAFDRIFKGEHEQVDRRVWSGFGFQGEISVAGGATYH